jgi:hypothetical protein
MKTLAQLLLALVCLCLVNCASSGGHTLTDAFGIERSGAYVDGLMGKHRGRDAEANRISADLIKTKAGVSERLYVPGHGYTSQRFTGVMKAYLWDTRYGGKNLLALRQVWGPKGGYSWTAPNPGTNFRGARDLMEFIIYNNRPCDLAPLIAAGAPL